MPAGGFWHRTRARCTSLEAPRVHHSTALRDQIDPERSKAPGKRGRHTFSVRALQHLREEQRHGSEGLQGRKRASKGMARTATCACITKETVLPHRLSGPACCTPPLSRRRLTRQLGEFTESTPDP